MPFIQIVETDDAFDWCPTADSGEKYDSVFQLRVIPDDVDKEIRKPHTRATFDNPARARIEKLDQAAYVAALLDYAIVGWTGVKAAGSGKDLECSTAMKARLPERWKAEILRLCSLKEAGDVVAQEKKLLKST